MIERDAVQRTRNIVLAYLSEMAAPVFRAIARRYVPAEALPAAEWRTLAIFGASHIGDVLFRTPSLPTLRQALPNCRILYVCAPSVAGLLTSNPNVDAVLPVMRDGASWRKDPATLSALRNLHIDAALCTDHIAYHADLLLALRAGIPARVGFVHKGFSGLVTQAIPARYPRPFPAYTRAMVAAVTGRLENWPLVPHVYPSAADQRDAEAVWRELDLDDGQPVVACTMTVRQRDAAVWPAERFLEALAMVASHRPIQIVLCGSGDDAAVLNAAATRAPVPVRVIAGKLGLLGFAAFLQRCDALLATDSGPRHIANAMGTPVVFIRSLNVSQPEAGVYCETETDVAPDGEFLSLPEQQRALETLLPVRVAVAVDQAIARRAAPRA